MRILVTGTWSKDSGADTFRQRARFTVAQKGMGMLSGRVYVTSGNSGDAKALADQLVATLKTDGAAKP